ncbi:hypothetical protein C7H62_0005 [Mesoflavibacter sp. HG96]|uniref:DUF2279 domain-containing protein n=1 Tax=unclassified Mesoflavibacter TaxID=2630131 RepID=UPI000D110672|nr:MULTISPECIES: DUF2279 domain-containing protein [unclassified Mesoflavibacter]QIJ87815.1 hypothetical protein C7H62_0005 [Mesoflavibacter sp. HG96]QIJ90543.1 hypothetical protein C7H56_0005 [Mesoflavibacter sp. HG37]
MYKFLIFAFFTLSFVNGQTKSDLFFTPSDTLHVKRKNAVILTESALGGLTLLGLNQLWYSDYERSKFHTINDNSEWFQMDKLGHTFTAYHLGRFGAQTLNWAGVSKKNQLIYGGSLGFMFLTGVEVLDGFSEEWGFSWGDFFANATGSSLYIGQELLWDEQRVTLKYSFSKSKYANLNPNKLGSSFTEQLLKDYNGQTYWLSINLYSFFNSSKIPKWLNVAVGYSADGLLYGSKELQQNFFPDQKRQRQILLSLDLDLTKVETNSTFLKQFFNVVNVIKIPFPTLQFNSNGHVTGHLVYF